MENQAFSYFLSTEVQGNAVVQKAAGTLSAGTFLFMQVLFKMLIKKQNKNTHKLQKI